MRNVRLFGLLALFSLILGTSLPAAAAPAAPALPQGPQPPSGAAVAKIEPFLLQEIAAPGTQADFFVWLADKADLSQAGSLPTKEAKGRFVFDTLRSHAERTQLELRAYLDAKGASYQAFYISNKILVRSGSQALLYDLAERPDVARLTANHRYQLDEPRVNPKVVEGGQDVGPNISFVNADDLWALGFTGQGAVLAGNDTGLDWLHPAIMNHYRGWNGVVADHNYNWWDATSTYPSEPGDGHGHGTHTTGTMVGDDGDTNKIGMAPGAATIHCKNMDDWGGGWDESFIECFQWDLAPWDLSGANPRPDLAPDAVNNSWGYWYGGYPTFEDEIAALQAAGILVEVSAGNEGPSCGTLRSPGDYGEVLTTGSVSYASGSLPGSLTWFSSRGPSTLSADFLPDVMAPGEAVRSAVPGGGYESWDGTSMAGPHVVGLVGLMWASNPGLRGMVPETHQLIFGTAVPLMGQGGSSCGGDYTDGPNNDWGYGTIDALAAVQGAMSFGGVGTLKGTVTDSATTAPLPGVQIAATLPPDLTWRTVTDDLGHYARTVFSGTYTVTAQIYAYYPAEITGVEVISGTTTILDIALDPAPLYEVSGRVTDSATGWPLYAKIDVEGYPGGPVWSDPLTGEYTISLAAGLPYTFHVGAWVAGYVSASRPVGPLVGPQVEDFGLDADLSACSAPGYKPDYVYFEDFEAGDGGFTADEYSSWAWGVPTSGPLRAHSGENVWATNLSGDYWDGEYGAVSSPDIDLSAYPGQTLIVSWWQWLYTEDCCDFATVEVSNDGGGSWIVLYGPASGQVNSNWTRYSAPVDPSFAVSNFRVRFILQTDGSVTYPGFYVDDVGIGVAVPLPNLYAEDFEAGNGGYGISGDTSWEWGTPTRGPDGAHSGINAWATNLSGNYGNNEDGMITSPPIDLSAGASGYESLELSWWQWLQTESGYDFASIEVYDGISWTEIITTSGIQNTQWDQSRYYLDPAQYAVEDFRVRFRLQSDESVTYPGFYLDDVRVDPYTPVPPAMPCNTPAGGLVVGNVYDANYGLGLNGASVSGSDDVALTQETPADDALDDGFYTLFALPGPQVITATLETGYGADVQVPTVLLGDAVRQDFHLPAGWLAFSPFTLEFTVDMGLTATLPITLTNSGGLAATYELRERNQGFVPTSLSNGHGEWLYRADQGVVLEANVILGDGQEPRLAYPAAYRWQPAYPSGGAPSILVYNDDWFHFAPNSLVDQALQYLGLPYTAHYDADLGGFLNSLTGSTWDLVIFAHENWITPDYEPVLLALNNYVTGGGRLLLHSWGMSRVPSNPLWATVGSVWTADNYDPPAPVYWWQPAHPMFTDPLEVPEFTQLSGSRYTIYGQYVEPLPDFETTGGYTTPGPDPNQAALIVSPDGDTVFRAFADGQNDADLDGDGMMDGTQLWINLISGVQYGFSTDVPWLFTNVVSGTLPVGGQQPALVTVDAAVPEVTQPGQYQADVRLLDDTPYRANPLPVTMIVNPPAEWGKLGGIVTGLDRCDAPGGPLRGAAIEIHDLVTLQPDANGLYIYWMPEGTYDVTVSAAGYVSQTFSVEVLAGETTNRDVDLRLDAPCTSPPAEELRVTVGEGKALSQELVLENSGAAVLSFAFLESPFDLSGAAARGQIAGPARKATRPPQTGPASVLTLLPTSDEPASVGLPASGWYGALDHPSGLGRYAPAQCAEQPDSYYTLSGMDADFSISTEAWRFDAAVNEWTQLADMPAGGEAPTGVCYGGKIYVMGGSGSDQFFIYHIGADAWTTAAPLPRGVEGAAAAAWDGKVYLVGGDDDFSPYTGVSDRVDVYDIATDTWIGTAAPMPVAASNVGFVQLGPFLYVTGGWNELSPDANVSATQRYDLSTDTWELGPSLSGPRADLGLAATAQALYAIAGDQNGGGFFDNTRAVESLELVDWPTGTWADLGDQLPIQLVGNTAGFCTQAMLDSDVPEVWSVGGLDVYWIITGRTFFQQRMGETCYSVYSDVPWLSVEPASGDVMPDGTLPVTVTFDAGALSPGVYRATLVIQSNDAGSYLMHIPITLTVNPIRLYRLPLLFKGND